MSAKKRFSINPELASGLRNSIQSASTKTGQLNYDSMDINVIELDPKNPRRLKITVGDLQQGLKKNDPDFLLKSQELESLQELSASIQSVGIRNAIEVYKEDSKYRVITGERRYLASILAKLKYVPVRINQKPNEYNLRYIQWVENINREDLSLYEKYNNLISIAEAYAQEKNKKMTVQDLKAAIGVSDAQAYRYYSLITAEKDLISLLETGKINSLKVFAEIANIKSKAQRQEVLKTLSEQTVSATQLKKSKRANHKSSRISINLNTHQISQHVFTRLISDPILKNKLKKHPVVDWENPQSIKKAYEILLKTLEQQLTNELEHAT